MSIPSIVANQSVKILSGLGNNSESIIPMAVKDISSDCAKVFTYRKDGGKDDPRESAIEEFGTGAVWLFGIPTIKLLINKTVYPFLKLDSNLDPRVLKNKDKTAQALALTKNTALENEKNIFSTLKDKNSVLKSFTNEQLYKGLFIGKFAIATAISAVALSKIIKFKQKTTQDRIEKDKANMKGKNNSSASNVLLNNSLNKDELVNTFKGNMSKGKSSNVSFTGLGSAVELFMYNPVANTAVLDGVITGTRIKDARKGEKGEITLKELFQLFFIYAIATPVQKAFEGIGNKIKAPIDLDPVALFDKDLTGKLEDAKGTIKELLDNEEIFETIKNQDKTPFVDKFKSIFKNGTSKIDNKVLKNPELLIEKLHELDPKNSLISLLDENNVISTIKDKQGNIEAMSYLQKTDAQDIVKSFASIKNLSSNISNLNKAKAFKVFAVLTNVVFSAWAMGVLQPKVVILMRKLLNNGDNRNRAIVEQEKKACLA